MQDLLKHAFDNVLVGLFALTWLVLLLDFFRSRHIIARTRKLGEIIPSETSKFWLLLLPFAYLLGATSFFVADAMFNYPAPPILKFFLEPVPWSGLEKWNEGTDQLIRESVYRDLERQRIICESVLPTHLHTLRDRACAGALVQSDTKALYDYQKLVLQSTAHGAGLLHEMKEAIVILRGAALHGLILFFIALLGAAVEAGVLGLTRSRLARRLVRPAVEPTSEVPQPRPLLARTIAWLRQRERALTDNNSSIAAGSVPRRYFLISMAGLLVFALSKFGVSKTEADYDKQVFGLYSALSIDTTKRATTRPVLPSVSPVQTFTASCDASAAVPLDDGRFVVASDEDSMLRIYSGLGGSPLYSVNVGSLLGAKGESETDLEAAVAVDTTIFWITSHAPKKNGKRDELRYRFFATSLSGLQANGKPAIIGKYVDSLLTQMKRPAFADLREYVKDDTLQPNAKGAVNIEGLAAMTGGKLLIGFRNPVPHGNALVVPLNNPLEVIGGAAADFGAPILLDLGGFGIRSIDSVPKLGYIIVAGAWEDDNPESRLYTWNGDAATKPVLVEIEHGLLINVESVIWQANESAQSVRLMLLSDDGDERGSRGLACKDRTSDQRFRSVEISIAIPDTAAAKQGLTKRAKN
jgi:hypothetical protein